MTPQRILAPSSIDLLARKLRERREAAREVADAFSAEARHAQVTGDNSDRLDPASPIGTGSEESYALAAHAYETFREADLALNRITEGTYGYCTECGEPIPFRRLTGLPTATTCVECVESRRPAAAGDTATGSTSA